MQSSKINDKRQRIELEFPLHCSANTLYNYISSPSGLSAWFADDVTVHGNNYVFRWDDGEELEAELLKNVNRKQVKFRWINGDQVNEILELIIHKDEVTDDLALIICDSVIPEEMEEIEMMWEAQVQNLKKHIGA